VVCVVGTLCSRVTQWSGLGFVRDLKDYPNIPGARKGFPNIWVFRSKLECDEAVAVLAIDLKVRPHALRSHAKYLSAF
jgi:hypothetical protein